MALSQNKKIALVVVLFAIAGFFVVKQFSGNSTLQNEINWVCVETGDAFNLDRLQRIPAVNPNTGKNTLLPAVQRDGKTFVDSHYRSALDRLHEVNQYVDPNTLEVRKPE